MANKERTVDLVVRARDQYTKVLQNLEAQQKRVAAAAKSVAAAATLKDASADVDKLRASYGQIVKDLERYKTAQRQAGGSTNLSNSEMRELGQTISLTQQRLKAVGAEYAAARGKMLGLTGSVKSGYAAFIRSAEGLTTEGAAANRVATQLKLVDDASKRVTASQSRMAGSVNTATGALARQGGAGSRGAKGDAQEVEFYGLKPWQMTNLGYQVNDVVSGLAMGQNPMQIFAQQIGQIVQIWPNLMVSLVRGIPVIAKLGAVFAPLIIGITEAVQRDKAIETFGKQLSTMADGANYSAEALTKITRNFEELIPLISQGMSQDSFQGFYDLAETLSNANGKGIAENVKTLADAFSGGVTGVRELDKELKFLTATQYQQMLSMKASGDEAGALAIGQKALEDRYDEFSRKAAGPWGQAAQSLGKAWKNLKTWLADTVVVRAVIGVFDMLGEAISKVAKGMADLTSRMVASPEEIAVITGQQQVDNLRAQIAGARGIVDGNKAMGYDVDPKDIEFLQELEKQLADVLTKQEEIVKVQEESTVETEEQKKTRADILLQVDEQIVQLQEEARLSKLTERARFVEGELLKAKTAALKEHINLTDAELAILKTQAGLTFDSSQTLSGNLTDKIIGVESGGNASAKNPLSSATGAGQFIESTWLAMFKRYFPDRAVAMGNAQILELRKDAALSRQMVELYAEENKKVLAAAGVAITDASVYLAHFLGPGGAAALLKADPNAQASSVLSADQVSANKSILQGKTAAEVLAWAEKKMGITNAELGATERLNAIQTEQLKTEKEYGEAYKARIEQQKFEIENASKLARDAEIAKAIREEELIAQKAGLTLSKEQRAEIERATGAAFDRANVETEVNALMERRSLLMASLELAQKAGDAGKVSQIVGEIGQTEESLNSAIDKAIAFYQALGGPAADAAILKLQNVKGAVGDIVTDMSTKYLPTAVELNEQIADMGGGAFSAFAQAIANGESAFDAFKNAMLQGLADIVIAIGQAIVKQALLNALTGGGATPGGGIGGTIAGFISGLFHSGGIIGGEAPSHRMVNPAVFANARRYHGGGIIKPNEVPIIAEVGEEMLTANDPRHSKNGGGAGGSTNVKNVNVFTAEDVLEQALASVAGERVIINWMTRNSEKLNGALA